MVRLRLKNAFAGALCRGALVFSLAAAMVTAACDIGVSSNNPGDDDDDDDDDDGTIPPPPPPPAGAAVYKMGSLAPVFQLLSIGDESRFAIPFRQADEEVLTDAQFVAAGAFPLLGQRMEIIARQLEDELGLDPKPAQTTPQITNFRNQIVIDQNRLLQMPMRGEPHDVALFFDQNSGQRKVFVPLSGGISTPDNEVAVFNGDPNNVQRIQVGIRPLRVEVHPLGAVFVCNKYSNYISVIDPVNEDLMRNDKGEPVRIATDFFCSDILLAEKQPSVVFDDEDFYMYVANDHRSAVLKYELKLVRDPINDIITDVVRVNQPPAGQPESTPDATIAGVGKYPQRLKLDEQKSQVYVTTIRGGEVALFNVSDNNVKGYSTVGGPSTDIIEIGGEVLVTTTTPFRGLLDTEDQIEDFSNISAFTTTGLDGANHRVHPGSLNDLTRGYNFEDVANGIQSLDTNLRQRDAFQMKYFTDDNSIEPNIAQARKVMTATVPTAIERLGNQLFVAGGGNNQVQILNFRGGNNSLEDAGNAFETGAQPIAIAIDADAEELLVVNQQGETLEIFDINSRNRIGDAIDLGYAQLAFPGTQLEQGKVVYTNTIPSNDGRKSCYSCHTDELIADGFGWSNGASAPTTYHQIQPTWNVSTTGNYFWQGSGFSNNSYRTLAYAAQTRSNCELIEFGFVDGPASDPQGRQGDPVVDARSGGNSALCQPQPDNDDDGLPDNFAAIAAETAVEQANLQAILVGEYQDLGVNVNAVIEASRFEDWWAASELRLYPNPTNYLKQQSELAPAEIQKINDGKQIFDNVATCGVCHQPQNSEAPFTDGAYHGPGALWPRRLVDRYSNDPDSVDLQGTAQMMISALGEDRSFMADDGINFFLSIDSFQPFAFDADTPLRFEDPTLVPIGSADEVRRLNIGNIFNMGDGLRGHWPGNPIDQHRTNTPSLRGVWWHSALLHTGLARTVREAILGPGHVGLRKGLFLNGSHPDDLDDEGETGWAFNGVSSEAHGQTAGLTADQVTALEAYLYSLE